MNLKEYIVVLKKNIDKNHFRDQMIDKRAVSKFLPLRSVKIANERPLSKRSIHFYLTNIEAESLLMDERVCTVELKDFRKPFHCAVQESNFDKSTAASGNNVNWGLRRCIETANPYIGDSVDGGYRYTLTGKGVDIVISDTGIQPDHPEFHDSQGVSRVKQIDWYSETGLVGTQDNDYYTDTDGRGTAVASVAAGKIYGWAKEADIYMKKISLNTNNGGDDISEHFDMIRVWHEQKPVDPITGFKRPTIVNISWGYVDFPWSSQTETIVGGSYRGTAWSGSTPRTDFGMVGSFHGRRISAVDADIEDLIDAGVHVVRAAPNNSIKADVDGGIDWDNFYTFTSGGQNTNVFYHRGASPLSDKCIVVGGVDSQVQSGTTEQIAAASDRGPGITVYAPSRDIFAAVSNDSTRGDKFAYPFEPNSTFQSKRWSGNSFAAPQATGILAFHLQLNNNAEPEKAKNWISKKSIEGVLYEPLNSGDDDYTNNRSLLGGENKFLYNLYNSEFVLEIRRVMP